MIFEFTCVKVDIFGCLLFVPDWTFYTEKHIYEHKHLKCPSKVRSRDKITLVWSFSLPMMCQYFVIISYVMDIVWQPIFLVCRGSCAVSKGRSAGSYPPRTHSLCPATRSAPYGEGAIPRPASSHSDLDYGPQELDSRLVPRGNLSWWDDDQSREEGLATHPACLPPVAKMK